MVTRPDRLFVYGTLQPGHLRWPFLEPFAVEHRPSAVPGRLYDSGAGWPVATFGVGPAEVPGTLVDLDAERLEEALGLLDEVEAAATDLLTRITVTTTDGLAAWAYHSAAPRPDLTLIERWDGQAER